MQRSNPETNNKVRERKALKMTILEELNLLAKAKAAEHISKLRTATVRGQKLIPLTEESLAAIIYDAMIESGELVTKRLGR